MTFLAPIDEGVSADSGCDRYQSWPPVDPGAALPARLARRRSLDLARGIACHLGGVQSVGRHLPGPITILSFNVSETAPVVSVSISVGDQERASSLAVIATSGVCESEFAYRASPGRWYMPSDLRDIIAAIADMSPGEPDRDLFLRAKLLELTCATFRHLRNSSLLPYCDQDFGSAQTLRILSAQAYVEARLHERLTLDRIARACGVNRTFLTKGFRRLFGCSVWGFLTEARLERARQLLFATDLPVSSVAGRCGYANNASFSRAFNRRFGFSPSEAKPRAIAGMSALASVDASSAVRAR